MKVKGIQTDSLPVKFDEGTQCEEERVDVYTQGVQTSPSGGTGLKNHVKERCPVQGQHPLQALSLPVTTTLTTTPQLSSTDAVTLIVSTAAAAAVAASASLHDNDKHAKVCLLKQSYPIVLTTLISVCFSISLFI